MTKLLLSVHVVAAIVLIGPVTVAVSLFPRAAREAIADPGRDRSTVLVWHRISRVYAVLGLLVPVFGLATAGRMGVLGEAWLVVSIALTLLAGVVLFAVVLPAQRRLLALAEAPPSDPDPGVVTRLAARASGAAGAFALLWVVVTVLMIVRPGSTTGGVTAVLTLLRVAAIVEVVSLVVLLGNLATVHVDVVAGLVGPVHGAAYVSVIAATLLLPARPAVRMRALLPGLGGLLALRALPAEPARPRA